MNTSKFTSAIATLSLVLFMSIASIANSNVFYSGDLPKTGDKTMSATTTNEKDLSYLRFDVNKYVHENETAEVAHSSLDYLRFDVAEFINETNVETMEMPLADKFDYLRFDVNNFIESFNDNMTESPANEFDYLRFDVNNFTVTGSSVIDELPANE